MNLSMNEFNDIKQLDVMTFRREILDVCQDAICLREDSAQQTGLSLYRYPPNIESSPHLPRHVAEALARCEYTPPFLVTEPHHTAPFPSHRAPPSQRAL